MNRPIKFRFWDKLKIKEEGELEDPPVIEENN